MATLNIYKLLQSQSGTFPTLSQCAMALFAGVNSLTNASIDGLANGTVDNILNRTFSSLFNTTYNKNGTEGAVVQTILNLVKVMTYIVFVANYYKLRLC